MSLAVQNELVAGNPPSAAPAAPPSPGKLIVAPADAAAWVLTQIERGQALRKMRIRYQEELEKGRARKAEWVNQTNDLLKGMFDTESVANDFNTWDVRVLPDYAELNLFIELFYEEMDQRLAKLQSIHRRIPARPAALGPVPAPARSHVRHTARATVTHAPAAPASAPPELDASEPPESVAPAEECHEPECRDDGDAPGQGECLLVADEAHAAEAERLAQFVSQLGFTAIRVACEGDDLRAAVEKLESCDDVSFAVVMLRAEAAAAARPGSGKTMDHRMIFQLGYCAGRLGQRRVCAAFPEGPGGSFCDHHGLLYVPLDSADGWQLQVARQLKRSGIPVDMNRIC